MYRAVYIGLVVATAQTISGQAMAQAIIDDVMRQYQTAAASWVTPLQAYATSLFWLLAGIQFVWAMASLALRGVDLAELVAEIINQIMSVGLFLFLVQQSATIAHVIIFSFTQAASTASGTAGSNPTQILGDGINMAGQIIKLISLWSNPGLTLVFGICAIVVLLCMAYIAAIAAMINIEAYIVVSALVLFTGFGGSRWTRDYAMRSVAYAMSVGGKLFMLNLVVGVGAQIIQQQTASLANGNANTVFMLIGVVVVLVALVRSLPDLMQSLLSGAAFGTHGALAGMGKGAAVAAVGGAVAVAGGAVAVGAAARAAAASAPAGAGAGGAFARAASFTGQVAKNLGSAAAADIGGRLSGTRMNRGSIGFRMAADINSQGGGAKLPPAAPLSPAAAGETNTIKPAG